MSITGVGPLELILVIVATVVVFRLEDIAKGTLKLCQAAVGLLKGEP